MKKGQVPMKGKRGTYHSGAIIRGEKGHLSHLKTGTFRVLEKVGGHCVPLP